MLMIKFFLLHLCRVDLKERRSVLCGLCSNGDILASSLADLLTKRFNGVECVQLPPGKGRAWGEWPDEKSIGQLVKEAEVNAVVVTVGC